MMWAKWNLLHDNCVLKYGVKLYSVYIAYEGVLTYRDILPVTPWFTPPYAVVHRAKNLYTLKPNHTNHTFWTKIIFKHVFGQFDVQ